MTESTSTRPEEPVPDDPATRAPEARLEIVQYNGGRMRKVGAVASLVLGLLFVAGRSAAALDGEGLRLLLLGAQDQSTPQTMQRADVTIDVEGPKGTKSTQAILFYAPGKEARWYMQVREPAIEALVLGTERKVMQRSGRTVETLPIGSAIDGLGFSYEDLSRFIVSDFKLWQIADDAATAVLVGGHPTVESAYVYRAYQIEKERTLPLRVQFYVKTLNNLVKVRVDDGHVLIGNKWLPTSISIEDYPAGTTAKLTLRWTQAASIPPELLAPASFTAAPPLPWTTPTPAPATSPKASAH